MKKTHIVTPIYDRDLRMWDVVVKGPIDEYGEGQSLNLGGKLYSSMEDAIKEGIMFAVTNMRAENINAVEVKYT